MDSSGWITIKNMVKEILLETGRDEGYYHLYMHHVINGVRELNTLYTDSIKTVKVTANSLGVINLPSDFIQEVQLSINYGGTLHPLTRRDDIISTTTLVNGEETLDQDIGEGIALNTGGDYGYKTTGGKNIYYYTLDKRKNRIIVRDIPTRTLFLQYVSSGISVDEGNSTFIPVIMKKALKFYVMFQDCLMNDNADKRLCQLYERNYYSAANELHFLGLPTASELEDMIYETYTEIRR
jgi:hypothetical protein